MSTIILDPLSDRKIQEFRKYVIEETINKSVRPESYPSYFEKWSGSMFLFIFFRKSQILSPFSQ
jgi:hypothetical protein